MHFCESRVAISNCYILLSKIQLICDLFVLERVLFAERKWEKIEKNSLLVGGSTISCVCGESDTYAYRCFNPCHHQWISWMICWWE